jgi:hypothetical protein
VYIYCVYIVVDREAAWNQILTLSGLGSGNSKANALFWAASRPPPRATYNPNTKPITPQQALRLACALNSGCDAIGYII